MTQQFTRGYQYGQARAYLITRGKDAHLDIPKLPPKQAEEWLNGQEAGYTKGIDKALGVGGGR